MTETQESLVGLDLAFPTQVGPIYEPDDIVEIAAPPPPSTPYRLHHHRRHRPVPRRRPPGPAADGEGDEFGKRTGADQQSSDGRPARLQ